MKLTKWAEKELEMLGNDEMQKKINKDILEIVKKFSEQNHSGFSANYAINIIKRLLSFKPIMPLTGEDDEWHDVPPYDNGENLQQNKRCSAVFRKNFDNSTAYYIEGKIFSDDDGKTWYTNKASFISVSFPYIVPDNPEKIILNKKE